MNSSSHFNCLNLVGFFLLLAAASATIPSTRLVRSSVSQRQVPTRSMKQFNALTHQETPLSSSGLDSSVMKAGEGYALSVCREDSDCHSPRRCYRASLEDQTPLGDLPCEDDAANCLCMLDKTLSGRTIEQCDTNSDCSNSPHEVCVTTGARDDIPVCASASLLEPAFKPAGRSLKRADSAPVGTSFLSLSAKASLSSLLSRQSILKRKPSLAKLWTGRQAEILRAFFIECFAKCSRAKNKRGKPCLHCAQILCAERQGLPGRKSRHRS